MQRDYNTRWRDIAKKRRNAVRKAKKRKDAAGVDAAGRQWAADMMKLINVMKYDARQRRQMVPEWANGVPFKTWYPVYLRSPHWQKTRKAALKRACHKCETCGSVERLQVHHLTYKRLRAELPEDLQVLCSRCHCAVHGIKAAESVEFEGLLLLAK